MVVSLYQSDLGWGFGDMGLRTAFPIPLGDRSVGVSVSPEPPSAIARWLLLEHKLCAPLETASSREQVGKYRRMARAGWLSGGACT